MYDSEKLYSHQTELALRNFPISGWTMPVPFLQALALIKGYAATVNGELGEISLASAQAIAKAATYILKEMPMEQFPVDVFQTGSGTSTNMNMNEVIAALARRLQDSPPSSASGGLRRAGKTPRFQVHPNDDVNCGQSSNDVIPSAMQIACALEVRERLLPSLQCLRSELRHKAKSFHSIIKTGRTHLMDAVPVRLGDEFGSYATLMSQLMKRIQEASELLNHLPLGGTAAGTGINAHPQFAKKTIEKLASVTKLPLMEAEDHIAAQSCPLVALTLSSALKEVAVALTKIGNDIRLMGSGPTSGFGELELPSLQSGSSIMPGKVNPVLCESIEQVAAWVIGADATVTACIGQGSRFELHTCYPLLASKLLTAITLLSNVSRLFAMKCVKGIKVNKKVITDRLAHNTMLVTALTKEIGYDAAAKIVREAIEKNESFLEVAKRRTNISQSVLKKILDPRKMV